MIAIPLLILILLAILWPRGVRIMLMVIVVLVIFLFALGHDRPVPSPIPSETVAPSMSPPSVDELRAFSFFCKAHPDSARCPSATSRGHLL